MVEIRGVDELGRRLKAISSEQELMRVAGYAFRKTARHIRTELVDRGRERGILRSIFAGNRKARVGLNRAVKLHRVRKVSGDFEAKLDTLGGAGALMTIQEEGGTFKPHEIKPKNAPRLAFQAYGKLVVTDKVNHPGARHPPMPLFWPTVRNSSGRLRQEIASALQNYFRGKAAR